MEVITNPDAITFGGKDVVGSQFILEPLEYDDEQRIVQANNEINKRYEELELANIELRQRLQEYKTVCTRLEADRNRLTQRMSKCTCEMLEAENIQLKLDLDAEVAAKMGVEEDLNSKLTTAKINLVTQVQIQNQQILQLQDEKRTLQSQNTALRNQTLWQFLKQSMCCGRRNPDVTHL